MGQLLQGAMESRLWMSTLVPHSESQLFINGVGLVCKHPRRPEHIDTFYLLCAHTSQSGISIHSALKKESDSNLEMTKGIFNQL